MNPGFTSLRSVFSVMNPFLIKAVPSPDKFGGENRVIIRGPGFGIRGLTAIKSYNFNIFNHVNFNSVTTTLNSGKYGRVNGVREEQQLQMYLRY